MSKRGMDASLAVQMDKLKKTMNRRDQRRDKDRQQRLVGMSKDDPYAQADPVRPSQGGGLRSGEAAQAAVMNAAALEGPAEFRCELCKANFSSEATFRQHEDGPAHKKALAREKAQRERDAWLENPSAASNALQAAAWSGGATRRNFQPARAIKPPAHTPAQRPLQNAPQRPQPDAPVPAVSKTLSHADRIAQAHHVEEPLNINGWMPPVLTATAEDDSNLDHLDSGSASLEQSESDIDPSEHGGAAATAAGSLDIGKNGPILHSENGEEQPGLDQGIGESMSSKAKDEGGLGLDYGNSSDDSDNEPPQLDSFF